MTTRGGVTNISDAAEPMQPRPYDGTELGVIDNLPFSGGFDKHELLDVRDITIDEIERMRRKDGQIRALFRVLSLPIRTTKPDFTPQEGEGSDGEQEKEFVEDALTRPPMQGGMTMSFSKVIAGMTLALADGFSVFEKVWHVTPNNKLVYRKLAPRAARTVRFLLDEHGGLAGVRQRTYWEGKRVDVTIPASKLLVYTAQHEENPWYGESYLLPAFYHYQVKHKLYYIAHLAYQFHAVPGRLGTYPQNATPDERQRFNKQLASMGFNTALSKASGWEVEEFGGKGTMPDFEKMINHHDASAAKSVLAHFIQLGTGSSVGSWALSQDQSDFFTMALEAILAEMSEVLYFYLVPQLVDYNFSTRAYPKVDLGPLADSTKDIMVDAFKTVMDAQAVHVTPEFLFELEAKVAEALGLEIDYDALRQKFEVDQELQRAAAVAAQKALMERAAAGGGSGAPDGQGGAQGGADGQQPPDPTQVAASDIVALADRIAAQMGG